MHFTRIINRTSTSLLCKGIEPKLWKWGEVLLAQTAFELAIKSIFIGHFGNNLGESRGQVGWASVDKEWQDLGRKRLILGLQIHHLVPWVA